MDYKLRKAADEEVAFTAKLRTDALGYEHTLPLALALTLALTLTLSTNH